LGVGDLRTTNPQPPTPIHSLGKTAVDGVGIACLVLAEKVVEKTVYITIGRFGQMCYNMDVHRWRHPMGHAGTVALRSLSGQRAAP